MNLKKIIFLVIVMVLLSACGSDDSNNNASSGSIPTVNAGEDKTTNINESITLTGVADDRDGVIVAYEWKEEDTILATTVSFEFVPTTQGVHTLTLRVTDDDGNSVKDSVNIKVISESQDVILYQSFGITKLQYSENSDWNSVIENLFGSTYRVADWNDLKSYYNNGGDLLKLYSSLGLTKYDSSAFVTRDGVKNYSASRYYFASRHEGHLPTRYSYLAHDNIGNYILSLGSWNGSKQIIAIKKKLTSSHSINTPLSSHTSFAVLSYSDSDVYSKNYSDVISREISNLNEWSKISKEFSFNGEMMIDLGLNSEDSSLVKAHTNKNHMWLGSWSGDEGYILLEFKDKNNNILHTFEYKKPIGYNSGYIALDGNKHNKSDARYQTDIHGYIYIKESKLEYDGEYRVYQGAKWNGLADKTWLLSDYDKIETVKISIGVKGTYNFAGIPLYIEY